MSIGYTLPQKLSQCCSILKCHTHRAAFGLRGTTDVAMVPSFRSPCTLLKPRTTRFTLQLGERSAACHTEEDHLIATRSFAVHTDRVQDQDAQVCLNDCAPGFVAGVIFERKSKVPVMSTASTDAGLHQRSTQCLPDTDHCIVQLSDLHDSYGLCRLAISLHGVLSHAGSTNISVLSTRVSNVLLCNVSA